MRRRAGGIVRGERLWLGGVVGPNKMWYVFFFSSRRRHTRFDCDWSSDVCSSDLIEGNRIGKHQGVMGQIEAQRQAVLGVRGRMHLPAKARVDREFPAHAEVVLKIEIGRASCRERV